jgi:hypothetical protein
MSVFGESGAPGWLALTLCGFRRSVVGADVRRAGLDGMGSLPLT